MSHDVPDPQPDPQPTAQRTTLPHDVVVGRVLRALTRAMWVMCAAAILAGAAGLALLGSRPDGALRAGAWTLLAAALSALAGAAMALGGALMARDAAAARRALAWSVRAWKGWSWASLGLIVAVGAWAVAVSHPDGSGVVGTALAALVGCQVVVVAGQVRRGWPHLLDPSN